MIAEFQVVKLTVNILVHFLDNARGGTLLLSAPAALQKHNYLKENTVFRGSNEYKEGKL